MAQAPTDIADAGRRMVGSFPAGSGGSSIRNLARAWPGVLLIVGLVLAGCGVGGDDATEDAGRGTGQMLPSTDARPPAGDRNVSTEAEGVPRGPEPVLEVERPFWWGEGTRGAEISASFITPEARHTVLDPEVVVGRFDGREWRLADILVQVRFRGPSAGATWQVSGPSDVIGRYLDVLREGGERSPLDEVGILAMEVEPCCGLDPDMEPRPDLPPQLF